MPKIGVVRWRRASEALCPLKTDGLAPRFVEATHESNPVRGAWLEPQGAGPGVMLYFHGGGFVFGSLKTHGELIGSLARSANARTFALEYRLAPEHPAPAAIDDAVSAYAFLLGEGISPAHLVLAGDSAGGNLVLATLLALRDRGLPLPAAGVALSPWVDLGCSGVSFEGNAAFDFVGEEHCRLAARHYLDGVDAGRPDVSPLFADLTGLPPLLIHAGGAEVLVDQIRGFASRAQGAGVDVTLAVYEDMVHVWHMLRAVTPEAQRAVDEVGEFVREHAT
ncbi:MAG: alpha/beta hydrolase [Planctomycetota bacterium]|nr:alpha/beta hydrolase [Planctomycetota bacterium]